MLPPRQIDAPAQYTHTHVVQKPTHTSLFQNGRGFLKNVLFDAGAAFLGSVTATKQTKNKNKSQLQIRKLKELTRVIYFLFSVN